MSDEYPSENHAWVMDALQESRTFQVLKFLWLGLGAVSLVTAFVFYCCFISTEDKLKYRSGLRSGTGRGAVRLFPKKKSKKT